MLIFIRSILQPHLPSLIALCLSALPFLFCPHRVEFPSCSSPHFPSPHTHPNLSLSLTHTTHTHSLICYSFLTPLAPLTICSSWWTWEVQLAELLLLLLLPGAVVAMAVVCVMMGHP